MSGMDRSDALRMIDHLTVDETVAIPALEAGRLVYALERPDQWGRVASIEPFRKRAAFEVTFASGHVRIFKRGGTFWVERERSAIELSKLDVDGFLMEPMRGVDWEALPE